jgi:hypothetical protein
MKPMTAKLVEFGNLRGTIYDANDVDDILPMHAHGEADVHITIVARDRLESRSGT